MTEFIPRTAESALITGAGSGIGRATAVRLAERGARVAVTDLDLGRAIEVAALIGDQALAIACDAADEDSLRSAIAQTVDEFGGLDTVVANAGIAVAGDVTQIAPTEYDRAMRINSTSVYLLARESIDLLRASGRGTFTAISSDAGIRGAQGWPVYAAAKHAVIGLVRSMALDFAPSGVRVNAVCPGWVDTPLLRGSTTEAQREIIARTVPMGRLAQPEDVAEIVAHLSDERSRHVSGIAYVIDGAQFAGPYSPTRDW